MPPIPPMPWVDHYLANEVLVDDARAPSPSRAPMPDPPDWWDQTRLDGDGDPYPSLPVLTRSEVEARWPVWHFRSSECPPLVPPTVVVDGKDVAFLLPDPTQNPLDRTDLRWPKGPVLLPRAMVDDPVPYSIAPEPPTPSTPPETPPSADPDRPA